MSDKSDVQRYVAEATEVVTKLVQALAREAISDFAEAKPLATHGATGAGVGGGTDGRKAKKDKAVAMPCPVTGVMNTHRRFSYLMPEARTPANLKKYRGWSKNSRLAS